MQRKRYLFHNEPIPKRTLRRMNRLKRLLSQAEETCQVMFPNRSRGPELSEAATSTQWKESLEAVHDGFEGETISNASAVGECSKSQDDSSSLETDLSSISGDSSFESPSTSDDEGNVTTEHSGGTLECTSSQGEAEVPSIDDTLLESDWYLNTPLCSATKTTKGDAIVMCLALGMRYSLPWTGIVDILKMINKLFGEEVVTSSKYVFLKYIQGRQGKLTYHLYCDYCLRYLGRKDEIDETFIDCICGKSKTNVHQTRNFFLSVNLREQLKELLREKSFVEALQYRYKRKKTDDSYCDVFDGELYTKLSDKGGILSQWYNFSYCFNTDGFPVGGKSGKQTCWGIYVQINELPPSMRPKFMLLAGLYVGKKDPDMHLFMNPFVDEANQLSTVGIDWVWNNQKMNSKVIPLSACLDTPARMKVLNNTSFNGAYGCSLCYTNPQNVGSLGLRYTLEVTSTVERTHAEILSDAASAHLNRTLIRNKKHRRVRGVKGPTPIHNLLYFDLVKSIRPDLMHSLMLGNARHHVSVLTDYPGQPFYIGCEVKKIAINKRLLSIKPPSCLPRAPRDFSVCTTWKANEWLAWILFYAIPCLIGILPKEYVSHLNLLTIAVHIVLQKAIPKSDLDKLEIVIHKYVKLFQKHFRKGEMVCNVHLLLHLRKSIEYLGPGWTQVAFNFEAANKYLLDLKKQSACIAKEIAHKYLTFNSLPMLCEKYASSESTFEFCQQLCGRSSLKIYERIGKVVLPGKGSDTALTSEEKECLSEVVFDRWTKVCAFDRLLLGGVRFCVASYGLSFKNDDSYICLNTNTKAQIQKILRYTKGDQVSAVVLIVRELIIDKTPFLDDDFAAYSFHQRIAGEGKLIAISPGDISGQCVAMILESGKFICEVPYGCYVDIIGN